MSYSEIVDAYVNKNFPNAYCMLLNKKKVVNLLATENDNDAVAQENGKGVEVE